MKKGFTLVELLATIALLSIVLAMVIPTIIGVVESTKKDAFITDVKSIIREINNELASGTYYDLTELDVEDLKNVFHIDTKNIYFVSTEEIDGEISYSVAGMNEWKGYLVSGTYENLEVSEATTPPTIALYGASTVAIEVGQTYVEAGATAQDSLGFNLASRITISGTVNNAVSGTYVLTYAVEDYSGNTASVTRTISVMTTALPTVAFGTNGNATYAKTRSTTVTVSDNVAINTTSLEYQWTTSTTAPTEASFTTTFTNGATLSTPAGVTGGYYLWILAKDLVGNTMIAKSNVFNLDNTIPTVAFGTNGNTTYAKTYSTTATVSDAGGSTVDTATLEYQWTTSTTAPTEASFTTTFTNGATLSTPAGVTGGYYLWILAKDALGNMMIARSNVFNIDDVIPVWNFVSKSTSSAEATSTITVTFSGTDSNYVSNSLTISNITIYVGAVAVSPMGKTLSAPTIISNGVQYTLTVEMPSGSGDLTFTIPSGTLLDNTANVNATQTITPGITVTKNSTLKILVWKDYHDYYNNALKYYSNVTLNTALTSAQIISAGYNVVIYDTYAWAVPVDCDTLFNAGIDLLTVGNDTNAISLVTSPVGGSSLLNITRVVTNNVTKYMPASYGTQSDGMNLIVFKTGTDVWYTGTDSGGVTKGAMGYYTNGTAKWVHAQMISGFEPYIGPIINFIAN